MSSSKAEAIEALDAAEAAYKAVAALPLHALSRFEQQALLNRLEELDRQLTMTERRLIGTSCLRSGAGSVRRCFVGGGPVQEAADIAK